GVPAIVHSFGSMMRQSPSLHGVARVAPPASSVLCAAKTAAGPSRSALVGPRLGGTTVHPVLRSRSGLMLPDRAWSPYPGTPSACLDGDQQLSQVPVRPSCVFALLYDSGRASAPRPCGASVLPPPCPTTEAPANPLFRSSVTRLSHSLSTLRSPGHPGATQDSLPVGGYPLPDGIRTHR